MPTNNMENNPYLETRKALFKDLISKKKSIEANYTPDKSEEYAKVKSDLVDTTIELLKLGLLYSDEEDNTENISVLVDDEVFTIPKDVVKLRMDPTLYAAYFDKDGEEDETDTSQEQNKEKPHIDTFSGDIFRGYMYPPFMSPFMMPANMAYPNPQKENTALAEYNNNNSGDDLSELLKDISNIQKKVILLEEERNNAKREVNNLNIENIAIRKDLEDNSAKLTSEKGNNEALNEKISDYENKIQNINSSLENAQKQITEKNELIDKHVKNIRELTEEKDKLEQQMNRNTDNYARNHDEDTRMIATLEMQKKSLEEKIGDYKERYGSLMDEKKAVEQKLHNAENTIGQKNQAIEKLKNDLTEQVNVVQEKLKNQLSDSEKQLNELKEAHKSKVEDLNKTHAQALEDAVARAKKEEYEKLEQQIKTANEQKEKAIADKSASEQAASDAKKEFNRVSNEKDGVEKKISSLEAEKKALTEDVKRGKDKIFELEESVKKLEKLAYEDEKTGLGNNNKFTKDFSGYNLSNLIVAMVSINDMKTINNTHGRSAGDRVIGMVADEIKRIFSKDKAYRILGDKFVILAANTTLNSVQGNLIDLSRVLNLEDINIVYGSCVGKDCGSHEEAIAKVEQSMLELKNAPKNNDSLYSNTQQSLSPIAPIERKDDSNAPKEINLDEDILGFMKNN